MARRYSLITPPFSATFLLLILLSNIVNILPLARSSLTTVSISETSNQTLICALTIPSQPGNNYNKPLNCTALQNQPNSPNNNFPLNNQTSFSETVSGDGFVCGLIDNSATSTSVLACGRFSAINGSGWDYKVIYDGPALRQIDAGNTHICAIVNATNQLECWQWHDFRKGLFASSASLQNLSKISVGENFVCGIEKTAKTGGNNVTCFGSNSLIVGQEPAGRHLEVSAGVSHACAVSAENGSLSCWGDINEVSPPEGRFGAIASGDRRSCGLRESNKTAVCWGENGFTLPAVLREMEFASIEGKRRVFCGVSRVNSSLYCWGSNGEYYSAVLESVLPGPCRAEAECGEAGMLAGSGLYCGSGMAVCSSDCLRIESSPAGPTKAPAPAPAGKASGRWNRKMVAFLVVGCVGCFCFLLVCSYLLFKYCKGRVCRVHDSGRLESGYLGEPGLSGGGREGGDRSGPVLEKRLSHLISLGNNGVQLEEFSLEVMLEATENFSEDRKIGTGSFGSVYHGTLEDGREVAIKRAESATSSSSFVGNIVGAAKRQEDKDHAFMRELELLSRLHHKNLVRLLGFYEDAKERVLVYEYMPNGSLNDHLHKVRDPTGPLATWSARIKVALDAARGVQYLHDFAIPSIIHRDIKSANILLDDTWTAKVSDFGLSLMGPEDDVSHLSLHAAGTVGYIDPEYFRLQKLTSKSDVYSFGVVLLELLSGQKAIHKNENETPRNVVDFMVPYIIKDEIHRGLDRHVPPPTPFEIEAVAYVGYLAADCVMFEGRDRPTMTDIVSSLERALAACLARPTLSRSTTESST